MKIISHRGNTDGPNPETENTFEAIEWALERGFDIEIDIWAEADRFWLGHDKAQRTISLDKIYEWSIIGTVYVHCKNIRALQLLCELELKDRNIFPFFHDVDDCILLGNNYLWVHPNAVNSVDVNYTSKCIAVVANAKNGFENWGGICTDYPEEVRNNL